MRMRFRNTLGIAMAVFVIGITSNSTFAASSGAPTVATVDPGKHFHQKGKMPSKHTKKIFAEAREKLPFSDRQDFEEQ